MWYTMEILLSLDGHEAARSTKWFDVEWKLCGDDDDDTRRSFAPVLRTNFWKEKKRQSIQNIRTSSATRECLAFVCDFGRCIVYTHMVAHVEIDTVTQTKHFPKMKMKCALNFRRAPVLPSCLSEDLCVGLT